MGIIEKKRKFKISKVQSNPTNPTGNVQIQPNQFDIDKKTIKEQRSKQ